MRHDEDDQQQQQQVLQSSLEAEYNAQRAHQVDAGAAMETGADSGASLDAIDPHVEAGQKHATAHVSNWGTAAADLGHGGGVDSQQNGQDESQGLSGEHFVDHLHLPAHTLDT